MTADPNTRPRVPVERSSPHARWTRDAMTSSELAEAARRLVEELKDRKEQAER
jgi:hypothetical protein